MIEQSDSESETSVCPPPVFFLEGGNEAAQPQVDDKSIIQSMFQREHPQHN